MYKRTQYAAISSILLLGLIFLSLPERVAQRLKLAAASLYLPLFGLVGSARGLAEQGSNAARSKRDLLEEIEQLRRENQQLRLQSAQSQQWLEENHRLRDALAWQRRSGWNVRLARVSARDPSSWWRTFLIDLGEKDGVSVNRPVLSHDGFLVGRIESVNHHQARVVLLGDPNCQVAATVENPLPPDPRRPQSSAARDGIITEDASSLLDHTVVNLSFIDRQTDARPGQRVLTNGKGGIFPPGIPIGHLAELRGAGRGLFLEASVKLGAELARIEEVFVLLP